MNQIFLLSGPIQTGKTTRLTEWIKKKNDVDGILQPVIDGKRYIKHISSGIVQLLEISPDSNEKNILSIGNYKFNNDVFTWTRSKLLLTFNKHPEWLIIDEVGKLEMDNKGLEPAISKILNDLNNQTNMNVVFVVRDYLVLDFLIKYCLDKNDIQTLEI
jgi:nucleoside-triphosphatase THEP1